MVNPYLLKLPPQELIDSSSHKLPYSIIFQPTNLSSQKVAIIYLHDWNKYSYTASGCYLGQELAKQGYLFLSLGMRRRGVEGQMRAIPDDDIDDIRQGIDYLKAQGCQNIILMGEGIGGLNAIRYYSKEEDNDLQGIILIRPFPNLDSWLKSQIGKGRYQAILNQSSPELIEGSEKELWVDLTIQYSQKESLLIYQSFDTWLSWWSPKADTKISDFLTNSSIPVLAVSPLETITEKLEITTITDVNNQDKLKNIIHSWISHLKYLKSHEFQLHKKDLVEVSEIIKVKTPDNDSLVGLLWDNNECQENKTVILHVRGKTGTPITEPLTTQFAEIYNKHKIAIIVIELHRSGYGGSLESLAEKDVEDIHAFVECLLKRGYTGIILSGQSLGSNSIMRYCVQYYHPNVMAMIHFAPTQDCANWLENHLGSDYYQSLVKQAQNALENKQNNQGLIGKPPYDKMLSPHRPDAWLSWWSPSADTANLKTIAEVNIPILMLCGSQDFFNDRERLETLKSAAICSPITDIIWYEGCGHNFANFEEQAARDVVTWLKKL
ncbi:MAG: DUF1749 domain-containing protein [Cyanobacteria bacterium P01_G01_bin.49]